MNDREALLAAARLLRERAAGAPPGRWYSHGIEPHMDGSHDYYQVETAADISGSPVVLRTPPPYRAWDMEHAAGMDPPVALALADLFEEYATRFPDRTADQHGDVAKKLIATARTYLRDL